MASLLNSECGLKEDTSLTFQCSQTPDMSQFIKAIYEKLECLVDPHLLFREVTRDLQNLTEQFNEIRKNVETVQKEIELLKHHRLKQFMWVKENFTKLEMDRDEAKEELERRTNALSRSMWLAEGAIRDHVIKNGLSDIPDIAGSGGNKSSPNCINMDPSIKNTSNKGISDPISYSDSVPLNTGIFLMDDDSTPRSLRNNLGTVINTEPQSLDNIFPVIGYPPEEVGNRLVAAVMAVSSRMHDVEKSQEQWKQIYSIQVNGIRAQMQQVQQESIDMSELHEDILRLKKAFENPEEKGLENKFMRVCAELLGRLNGRVDNLERNLEKEKEGEFNTFAKNTCEGICALTKTQTSANELIRRTQQVLDQRKAYKAARAIKAKDEMEMNKAMRFAHMVGNIRSSLKTDVVGPGEAVNVGGSRGK